MSEKKITPEEKPVFIEREPLYKGFLNLYKDRFLMPHGKTVDYETLCPRSAAAIVLPVLPDGRLVIVKEYRYPLRRYLLSLPGGYIDDGETAEEAALREMREEVGLSCDEMMLLGKTYPYAGISDQCIYYLTANHCVKTHSLQHEASELITTEAWELKELVQALRMPSELEVDGNLTTCLFYYLQSRQTTP